MKVLLVDDNAAFVASMAELLRLKGHTTLEASTCTAARRMIADQVPDVVLLDVSLPDAGHGTDASPWGFLVAGQVIPVVILTGHELPVGMPAGVPAMRKPVDPDILVKLLEATAEAYRLVIEKTK